METVEGVVIKDLNLNLIDANNQIYALDSGTNYSNLLTIGRDDIHTYFPENKLIQPDNIVRNGTDSTLFTTAGIQYLENISHINNVIPNIKVNIYQPCIRAQYIDEVKEGVSTSFINFTSIITRATPDDFSQITRNFLSLILSYGIEPKNLSVKIRKKLNQWGEKSFNSTVLKFSSERMEIGESIFMHEFYDGAAPNVVEVGLGQERFNFLTKTSNYYFNQFGEVYTKNISKLSADDIASVIDCVRTGVLIAGSGIKPSNNNHGYRLRMLLKAFVKRNEQQYLDANDLMTLSYADWTNRGNVFKISEDETNYILNTEIDRNYNALIQEKLVKIYGVKSRLDINKSRADFMKNLEHKCKSDGLTSFLDKIKENIHER